ncbi:cell wall hydrolase [Ammoniphilus sp. CFH 90114]|uniref:cell wall hydrolase n=1 Tax=Ammoniphilus sp. CFH 90114 TaxID=2493665 RepID=UPI00100E4DE4|nr:cell wall hydrolase [Ammoniphilus sp. CFH 90114]RXT05179.1 cell wall hydrolase [Ammoniphilus sp. CFH 90114]
MKNNLTVLTIVVFFVGSIAFNNNHWVAEAKEWDQADEIQNVSELKHHIQDGSTKKMKDSMIRQPVAEPDLTQEEVQQEMTLQEPELKPEPLPEPKPEPQAVAPKQSKPAASTQAPQDLQWLARIIHAEAKGEQMLGKVAVGAVVLNRVKHEEFPKSIYKVIHQKNKKGKYQFQPVANGKIHNQPDQDSIEAAKLAMKGNDPTNGALFFYNPKLSRSNWMANLPKKAQIGNHIFAGS